MQAEEKDAQQAAGCAGGLEWRLGEDTGDILCADSRGDSYASHQAGPCGNSLEAFLP